MDESDDQYSRPGIRPAKRPRTVGSSQSDAISPENEAVPETPVPRTRGPTACEKCRSRKTRCDNRRPRCGYCTKHETRCVYAEDVESSSCAVFGPQILQAISNLSSLVSQQPGVCSSCSQHLRSGATPNGLQQTVSPIQGGPSVQGVRPVHNSTAALHDQTKPQGIESVLDWNILAPFRTPVCLFSDDRVAFAQTHAIPAIDYRELSRLASKYIVGVHLKNPFLDLFELTRLMSHVAENGLDWSSRTCLATLVCAIGAITQEYRFHGRSPVDNPTPGARHDVGTEPELSLQFWNLAVKRLGLVIGENDPIAIQCLCLAGIWSMHQMRPLQAWKYFNLAGAAWHSVNLTNPAFYEPINGSRQGTSFTVAQSLYFTIWKSECELQFELNLPSSILEKVDFPYTFPHPPDFDPQTLDGDGQNEARSWFYYLAEIAIRHLLNRLLRSHSWSTENPNEREIRQLLTQSQLLETQLHDWHTSLPATLNFEIPEGYSTLPHEDDLIQILRQRYLSCRELIARPFLKLCVETTLEIEPQLRSGVISLASQSPRILMLRLSQVTPYRHQGNWFLLRTVATTSLILGAVHLASRRLDRKGAQAIMGPTNWKEKVTEALDLLEPYWNAGGADTLEMKNVVLSVLDACQ